jgi:hypothetical protein
MPAKGEKITDEAKLEILRKGREKAAENRRKKAEEKRLASMPKVKVDAEKTQNEESKGEPLAPVEEDRREQSSKPESPPAPPKPTKVVIQAPEPEEEIIYVKKPKKKKTVVYVSASESEADEPPPPPVLKRPTKPSQRGQSPRVVEKTHEPSSPTHPDRYTRKHNPQDGIYEPKYHHRERQNLYKSDKPTPQEPTEPKKTKQQLAVDSMFAKYYGS